MIVVYNEYPPNYADICAVIPSVKGGKYLIFAYGDRIFVPSGNQLDEHYLVHEEAHGKIQREMGVEKWWEQYLESPRFRLEQELIAYKVQYEHLQRVYPRYFVKLMFKKMVKDIAGPFYGKIITKAEAAKLIKGTAEL